MVILTPLLCLMNKKNHNPSVIPIFFLKDTIELEKLDWYMPICFVFILDKKYYRKLIGMRAGCDLLKKD